jgi:phosphinothricin acetyltransferase
MDEWSIEHCGSGHYDAIVRIYNHYVEHSHVTFDEAPFSIGARAPWFALFADEGPYQLLVAVQDGSVLGFCCSTPFHEKSGYAVSVETSIYVSPDELARGVGSVLYEKLFDNLHASGLHRAYGGIALPNDACVRLHEKLGFRKIGVFEEAGRKFDKYRDVVWYEKHI